MKDNACLDGPGGSHALPGRGVALADLPAVAICGDGRAEVSRVTEAVAGKLRAKRLRVAVLDGAASGEAGWPDGSVLTALLEREDLVLVAGSRCAAHPGAAGLCPAALCAGEAQTRWDGAPPRFRLDTLLPRVWLGRHAPPADAGCVLAAFPLDPGRLDALANFLAQWLTRQWRRTPVCGAVLIGGRSRRMGRPKHLLKTGRKTWLQRTVEHLRQVTDAVVLVGEGLVPAAVADLPRLPDAPEASGPIAGILSAMRWAPHASWLISACDLPNLNVDALRWLLSTRLPGVWATLPRLPGSPGAEPLLAHYDFRARPCLEELVREGIFRPAAILRTGKGISPAPPPRLIPAWTNVNTRSELRFGARGAASGGSEP